jgi:ribonuclease E
MGTIRGVESMSLALLRLLGEEARKERTGRVIAQVPVDVATYLINEKRDWLNQIEARDKVSLVIVPNPHLQTPAYNLRRIRDDEKELPENATVSYQLADQPVLDDSNIGNRDKKPPGEAPVVPSILPTSTAPIVPMPVPETPPAAPAAATPQAGALVRLWRWLFGTRSSAAPAAPAAPAHSHRTAHREVRHDRYRSGGDRDRSRDRNRDVRRDGPRDPRRDGRPRGDRHEGGPRRAEGATPAERNTPRGDAPRADQPGARTEAARVEAPRGDSARSEPSARSEAPGRNAEQSFRPEGADRSTNDRPERSGRSRRRRGRGGRRDGGEGTVNGQAQAQTTDGTSPAGNNGGRLSEPAPRSDFAAATSAPPVSAPAYSPSAAPAPSLAETPRERPLAPPVSEAPPRAGETPPSGAGSENKYVVWSSVPSDAPRSGPDDR